MLQVLGKCAEGDLIICHIPSACIDKSSKSPHRFNTLEGLLYHPMQRSPNPLIMTLPLGVGVSAVNCDYGNPWNFSFNVLLYIKIPVPLHRSVFLYKQSSLTNGNFN